MPTSRARARKHRENLKHQQQDFELIKWPLKKTKQEQSKMPTLANSKRLVSSSRCAATSANQATRKHRGRRRNLSQTVDKRLHTGRISGWRLWPRARCLSIAFRSSAAAKPPRANMPLLAVSLFFIALAGSSQRVGIATASLSQDKLPPLQASFSTPNQATNITHVTYDPLYDTVYLGATDSIYQLNGSDLSEQHHQSTGPVLDNPSCGISQCLGYEDHMKITHNVNKVLVIDYQHQKLLSCGSTRQGACRRYQLNNIAHQEDLIPMAVAANDDNSSTYAFIAPARYTFDPTTASPVGENTNKQLQQQVLYVAATYTKVGQSRDLLVPAIASRTLDDGPNLLKLYENSFLDSARIDINSHLRDYFLVNYLYGFASSNYIYFVTVQKKATSRDYEELGYHTRLARVCITDPSYNSYTEVDLKCMTNKRRSTAGTSSKSFSTTSAKHIQHPDEYPLLQDALLVEAGSHLLQSLGNHHQTVLPDDSKVLLGVFSSAKDHTQHAGEHSALCAFSLSQIEDKFNDNIHNCYTGKMSSRNMEYIAGNVQECPKAGQGGNVVNFCHESLKINGTIPIVSEASIQFYNTTLTAITATSHINTNSKNIYSDQLGSELANYNVSKLLIPQTSQSSSTPQQASGSSQTTHTVAFLGTLNGHIKKVLLNNASDAVEFDDVQLDSNPILSDLHLHSSGQYLIAATPHKVMKVPTHNCTQYTNCRECSQSRNPYCGWCSLKRSCTTSSECLPPAWTGAPADVQAATSSPQATVANRQQQLAELGLSSSRSLKWISIDSASKCIDLQAIVPDRIPFTSTGKVDLYIDRLPRLPKDHSYKCIFDRREQTVATPTAFGLSCLLPKVMHRTQIQPGRDHAIVDLTVRSSETNTDFLNGKITFFDCQLHTTCKDCLTTSWGCSWCSNENACLFNTSKCEKGAAGSDGPESLSSLTTLAPLITISSGSGMRSSLSLTGSVGSTTSLSSSSLFSASLQAASQPTSNTVSFIGQCPSFVVGSNQETLVADGTERGITMRVRNMPQIKGSIQCLVEIENDKIPLRARIDSDRIVCQNSTFTYSADVGSQVAQLSVVYSDNNILLDRTNLTIYKCHHLGTNMNRPDCQVCQRLDSRFNCAWCSGGCRSRSDCTTDEACPQPRIDPAYSNSGPSLSGAADRIPKVMMDNSAFNQGAFDEMMSPPMVEQIYHSIENTSEHLPYLRSSYPQRDNESLLSKAASYFTRTLLILFYTTLGSLLLLIVYSIIFVKFDALNRRGSYFEQEHRRVLAKVDSMERLLRAESKLAATTLRSDLNELVRHIDLSGIPLLNPRDYIMKVFFPGINNHPLLLKQARFNNGQQQHSNATVNLMTLQQQQLHHHHQHHRATLGQHIGSSLTIQHPLKTSSEFPMENFERLILTKPFLITFINTLEMQPGFNIRDKVNVASLVMVVLMERLDYATDVMKTLLFQLVERSVSSESSEGSVDSLELDAKNKSHLSRHASNILGALPIKRASRAAELSKVVGGSASSLMASTTVAAQMFLAKVGNKTSPLQPNSSMGQYMAQNHLIDGQLGSNGSQYFSTTAFNQRSMIGTRDRSTGRRGVTKVNMLRRQDSNSLSPAYLMLRRTDSVVEKMLTNWLALNMQDYFHGEVGRSLYLLFEALKSQLERGPIDAVSGEAYYSLNENKLLREPNIQFNIVNLYVIVDTSILRPNDLGTAQTASANNSSLLLDPSILNFASSTPFYGECDNSASTMNRSSVGNTITMALRVLDCDTISQVKSKILGAIYRNSPYSARLGVDDVELGLRQQNISQQQSLSGSQYVTVALHDEETSSALIFNGLRRLNTLRSYGVTEQAIMTLQRGRTETRTGRSVALSEILDDRYNSTANPYSEIPYDPFEAGQGQTNAGNFAAKMVSERSNRNWHLVRIDKGATGELTLDAQWNDSSPASHSPSMMLLGNEQAKVERIPQLRQLPCQPQQFYHPSTSSTSSTGNVMDTNSTSANSSSVNVTNLLMKSRCEPQPIYCQIGSAQSQQGGANSNYYCQVGPSAVANNPSNYHQNNIQLNFDENQTRSGGCTTGSTDMNQERQACLARMLASKGAVQDYVDDFFKTILNAKPSLSMLDEGMSANQVLCTDLQSTLRRCNTASSGACPPAVKWLFDLLDEAAVENGITDPNVIHSWKSNAFLLRFWVNMIKNPNYVLDVEKSNTLDASLSVIAQTLMDSCAAVDQKLNRDTTCNKVLFAKDTPKYRTLVKRFYQDISSMRPVSDLEMAKQMSSLAITNSGRFDTNLALKELCVYAVNYGPEVVAALNNDYTCQQLDLGQKLEGCFRSFSLFG